MIVTNDKRREVAAKVRETMGALGQVELDGIPLADLIEPEERDGCEPGAWEVVAMEVAERLGVAVGGCLPSDYADAIGEALDRRLMPEVMEWPRFEDGAPVRFGDKFIDHQGNERSVLNIKMWQEGGFEIDTGQGTYDWHSAGERIRRPAPKVLDADGVEVEVGDDLYSVEGMLKFHVSAIDKKSGRIATEAMFALDKWADPKMYTHRAPVLAADGKQLREGETVWDVESGIEYEVVGIHTDEDTPVRVMRTDGSHLAKAAKPNTLTHQRPVSDTWERLEDDATKPPYAYCVEHGLDDDVLPTNEKFARDLVRRAKELAERGQ